MNGVNAHQEGNSQAGLGGQHLQLVGLFAGENVQESTHLSFADALGQFGIAQVLVRSVNVLIRRTLIRGNIAGPHVLAHLADFFFQGHLLQQEGRPLCRGQRGVAPVLGRAGGQGQEGGKQ